MRILHVFAGGMAAAGSLLVQRPCSAQVPISPVHANIDYNGPSVPDDARHQNQRLNVFHPPHGTPPAEGWPVVVFLRNAGFHVSLPVDEVTDEPATASEWNLLQAGVAVVTATCTVARGGNSPNDADGGAYGPAYCGNGLFIPPGVTPDGYDGCPAVDYSLHPDIDPTVPFDDPFRPMPEKDAVMIVQHLKYNASAYVLDRERIGVWGNSGSAVTWMWVVHGPDRSDMWSWSSERADQEFEDTRVFAAALEQGGVYWPHFHRHYKPKPEQGAWHFPARTGPEPYLYDLPCEYLDATFADWLLADSALLYGTEPGTIELNAVLPVYLQYDEPAVIGDLEDPDVVLDIPLDFDVTSTFYLDTIVMRDTVAHSSWSGHALDRLLPCSFLGVTHEAAYHSDGTEVVDGPPDDPLQIPLADRAFASASALGADQHDWWLSRFAAGWTNEGYGAPGLHGTPCLEGRDPLLPGASFRLSITHARPSSSAWIVVSGGPGLEVTIFGAGTLLGTTPLIFSVGTTDTEGRVLLQKTAPTGLESGAQLLFQGFVLDPDGVQGFAQTNVLSNVVG